MVILILAMLAMAQATPAVEEILARYEAATGDPAIARAYETRVIHSTIEDLHGGETDVYEYFRGPAKYLRVTVRPEGAVMRLGFDGKSAWSESPRGLTVVPGADVPAVARDAAIGWHLQLRELYPRMRVAGPAKVAGKAAWQVEATTPQGDNEQLFFDAATGLLLRRRYDVLEPGGVRFSRDVIYEEYADYDGVKLPSVTRHFSPYAAVLRVRRVTHNADVYDYAFAQPKCGAAK